MDSRPLSTADRAAAGTETPRPGAFAVAFADLRAGLAKREMWWTMAVWDIKRRYRRTLLGPFWSSASHAIYIGALGVLFAHLWKQDVAVFLPYFASGFLTWVLVSTLIVEGCGVFVSSEALLKQNPLPYSTFVWVLISRNLIVMAHHLAVFAFVAAIFGVPIGWATLLAIPGLAALIFAVSWIVLAVGIVCARYRDVQQLVVSFLQLAMFVTPIFWAPETLPPELRNLLVEPNVLYHAVMLVRMPLLGQAPEAIHWYVTLGAGCAGWVCALWLFGRYRRYLIFWL